MKQGRTARREIGRQTAGSGCADRGINRTRPVAPLACDAEVACAILGDEEQRTVGTQADGLNRGFVSSGEYRRTESGRKTNKSAARRSCRAGTEHFS